MLEMRVFLFQTPLNWGGVEIAAVLKARADEDPEASSLKP